jgi:hypothetical protein
MCLVAFRNGNSITILMILRMVFDFIRAPCHEEYLVQHAGVFIRESVCHEEPGAPKDIAGNK